MVEEIRKPVKEGQRLISIDALRGFDMFWIIGGDPLRYRALMPVAVAEKLVFGLPALALFARGYPLAPPVAVFAGIDLVLGLGFYLAWRRTAGA